MPRTEPLTLVHFSADVWEHVCPVQRILGPAQMAGWPVIHGNEWENGEIRIYPERVTQADLVIIQRDFPRFSKMYDQVLAQARLARKPVIYELDDLLIEMPDIHPDAKFYREARADILTAIAEADAITSATQPLADYLRHFNNNVWVLPNYLNDRFWRVNPPHPSREDSRQRPVIIGYMGTHTHLPDLEMIVPVLKHILEKYADDVLLRLWGVSPPDGLLDKKNLDWHPRMLTSYIEFSEHFSTQECDIFIAPLLDHLFNQCKSPMKFLEYSALGVPGVFSRIAPYSSIVESGRNGFLASSLEEWEDALIRLIESPALRYDMGRSAQDTLLSEWLLSNHIDQWREALHQIYVNVTPQPDVAAISQIVRKFRQWNQESQHSLRSATEQNKNILAETKAVIRSLENKLAEKEAETEKLSDLIAKKELKIELLNAQLNLTNQNLSAITASPGWRLLEAIYRIRLLLAPRGSRRERWLRSSVNALLKGCSLVRRHGTGEHTELVSPPVQPSQQWVISPGEYCPIPAVSIVIEQSEEVSGVDEQSVLEWLSNQSLKTAELVVWNRKEGIAHTIEGEQRSWKAPDILRLCEGLRGRYLCMASKDLLHLNSTYLEANVIALESESLSFTININGQSDWALKRVSEGYLPGNSRLPLFRMVVHKNYVREGYQLDLSQLVSIQHDTSVIAGKVIVHTTEHYDDGVYPLETSVGEVQLNHEGRYILVCSLGATTQQIPPLNLHPVDSILPASPEAFDLPTVIMVMPFIAVGGAEQHALLVLNSVKSKIQFVILTFDELDSGLGTLSDAFREITPWVYNLADFLDPNLRWSFLSHLIQRYQPVALYIANGAAFIYDMLPDIKQSYPDLRIINQVYDHMVGWINRYDVNLLLNIDAHIGVNRKICQAYVDRGVKPKQIYLIENGIDPSHLNPDAYSLESISEIKQKLGVPAEKKVVTFASRIHPQKRPVDFVELARRFSSDPSIAFLMVGDGPLSSAIDKLVVKMELRNFYRHSFYRPISDILAISDVLVLPSEYEGMPMIILEAQAMGKPVVVTDVGNNREVLAITQGGIVVPQIGDVEALKRAVHQMLDNPPDPTRMRQATLSHYSIEIVAQKYLDVFLGNKRA